MIDFKVQPATRLFFFFFLRMWWLVCLQITRASHQRCLGPLYIEEGRTVHHVATLNDALHANRVPVAWQPDWQGSDPPPFCAEHGSTVFTFIFQPCTKNNTQPEPNWKYLSGINCCIINFSISFGDFERRKKSLQGAGEQEAVAAYLNSCEVILDRKSERINLISLVQALFQLPSPDMVHELTTR